MTERNMIFADADEHPHEADHPHFNESFYFNFVDPGNGLYGLMRVGNRLNEGHGEVTVLLFLPDGKAAFRYVKPAVTVPTFDLGGVSVEIVKPHREVRIRYTGDIHVMADGRALEDPRSAFADSPIEHIDIDVLFTTTAPSRGWMHGVTTSPIDVDATFAPSHYEAPGRLTGRIRVGTRDFAVDGHGVRDHSWGPRTWQGPEYYRWISVNAPDGDTFVAWLMKLDGLVRHWGFLFRDGEMHELAELSVRTRYGAPPELYPQTVTIQATAGPHQVTLTGERVALVPLRHHKKGDASTARLSELVFCYDGLGDAPAYGVAEFHDLITDGHFTGYDEA